MDKRQLDKYKLKFSSDRWKLEKKDLKKIEMIFVIPALAEYDNLKQLFTSILQCDLKYKDKFLIVIVVNNTKNISEEIKTNNKNTLEFLRNIILRNNVNDELIKNIREKGINVAYVDASSPNLELPEKDGGVGFARKIGMDLALDEFNPCGQNKILICTDSDAQFAENYFTEIYNFFNSGKYKAAHIKYEHPIAGNSEERLAIICYEIFLRYYVAGLKYANSYYAFHTIGSSMACDTESYIKIQGMNKRKAAEDFYFLEKLAKVTEIGYLDKTKVIPSGRKSWRVPFGTGQRVARFLSQERDEYKLYAPDSFTILQKWLELFDNSNRESTEYYIDESRNINEELYNFLNNQNFVEDWKEIKNNAKTPEQVLKQKRMWFDGFRTLKLIHYLRDNSYPDINMFDALDKLLEKNGIELPIRKEKIPSEIVQMEYLSILREIT